MWTDRARRSSSVQLSSASCASRAQRSTSSTLVYSPLERRLLIRVSRSGGTFNCMACFSIHFHRNLYHGLALRVHGRPDALMAQFSNGFATRACGKDIFTGVGCGDSRLIDEVVATEPELAVIYLAHANDHVQKLRA